MMSEEKKKYCNSKYDQHRLKVYINVRYHHIFGRGWRTQHGKRLYFIVTLTTINSLSFWATVTEENNWKIHYRYEYYIPHSNIFLFKWVLILPRFLFKKYVRVEQDIISIGFIKVLGPDIIAIWHIGIIMSG